MMDVYIQDEEEEAAADSFQDARSEEQPGPKDGLQ